MPALPLGPVRTYSEDHREARRPCAPKGHPVKSALDKLPIQGQHLVIAILPVLLGWAGSDLVPYFQDKNPTVAYLVGVLLTIATAWATKVTTAYGRGSDGAHEA